MDKIDFWGEVREQGTQEQETGREFVAFISTLIYMMLKLP